MAGVAGMQVASVQVVKNQFSTARIMSDIFAMANVIYLRYDIFFSKKVKKHPLLIYVEKWGRFHIF